MAAQTLKVSLMRFYSVAKWRASGCMPLFSRRSNSLYRLEVPPRWPFLRTSGPFLAGELGFEPRLTESESAVLPLNYPPIGKAIVECNLGRSRRLVSLSRSARGSNVDTSRTSCAPFQAATAQTPLMPCVGPACRMPRWRSPLAHRRRRREIPRAGTHDRGTARRSRAPPCRRYESRW